LFLRATSKAKKIMSDAKITGLTPDCPNRQPRGEGFKEKGNGGSLIQKGEKKRNREKGKEKISVLSI